MRELSDRQATDSRSRKGKGLSQSKSRSDVYLKGVCVTCGGGTR